jgi:hypothetical protein
MSKDIAINISPVNHAKISSTKNKSKSKGNQTAKYVGKFSVSNVISLILTTLVRSGKRRMV